MTLLFTSCSSPTPQTQKNEGRPTVQERKELRLVIPKDTWEPLFFQEINERARIAKLTSLRSIALQRDDLEARVWIGFGGTRLVGFDLKRSAGQWSALFLEGIDPHLSNREFQRTLKEPKSGWETCWRRLTDAGILILPDARAIDCQGGGLDGVSYVVETNMDWVYRTYMYDNPQDASCKEAKQMIQISQILNEEFGM